MMEAVAGVPAGQRIGTMTLVQGAISRMRVGGWRLLVCFAVFSAVAWAQESIPKHLQVETPWFGTVPLDEAVDLVVTSVVWGLESALGIRVLLGERRRWLEIDRPFLDSVGLNAFVMALVSLLATASVSTTADTPSGSALATALGLLTLIAAMLYAWLKVLLWPIGRLMGRNDITPMRSWRLMRKATRGYLLAFGLCLIPFGLVTYLAIQASGLPSRTAIDSPVVLATLLLGGTAVVIFGQALSATVYTLRVDAPSSVADVFD